MAEWLVDKAEEWRPVPGWEGIYDVSNHGRVRSLDRVQRDGTRHRGRVRKNVLGTTGYHCVLFTLDCRRTMKKVHRLVAAAFLGPCPAGYAVNHLDGNKLNNCPENLEYVTTAENARHASLTGLLPMGVNRHMSKITEAEVREIRSLSGKLTQREIGRKYGIKQPTVSEIISGKYWCHVVP